MSYRGSAGRDTGLTRGVPERFRTLVNEAAPGAHL